jgi:alkanesulfonate monooxygenase SsuD/methylene tetrahydromethanopterin reductase-like flavin-dependent oxidoreductase (luciferase family)
MSGGRAMFGMGRGLSPKEYAAFGIDQGEARQRFDEMAPMITRALETGIIEGDGPFYPLEPHELRPRPVGSFRDRTYAVASSASSAAATARVGARLVMNVAEEIDKLAPLIEVWQKTWRENWDSEPPPPVFSDFTFCTRDAELTERARREWYPTAWDLTLDHYQLNEVDFTKIKGYESHAERKERPPYADTQVWGSPEEIIAGYRKRIEVAGSECAFTSLYRFGGMPADIAEKSMRLFAAEVLPEIKKLAAPA